MDVNRHNTKTRFHSKTASPNINNLIKSNIITPPPLTSTAVTQITPFGHQFYFIMRRNVTGIFIICVCIVRTWSGAQTSACWEMKRKNTSNKWTLIQKNNNKNDTTCVINVIYNSVSSYIINSKTITKQLQTNKC